MKKIILFIISLLLGLNFNINKQRLQKICVSLKKEYKNFGIVLSQPFTGEIVFVYNKGLIFYGEISPGSLIKPFTLISLSEYRNIDPEKKFFCNGWNDKFLSKKICWYKYGHKYLNLYDAIAFSCNVYFYKLIKENFNPDEFLKTLLKFNLIKNKLMLSKLDFIMASIGKGNTLKINPFKILSAYNSIFNNGFLYNKNGILINKLQIKKFIKNIIIDGMRRSARYGTGSKFYISGIKNVAVKTGTGMYYDGAKWDFKKTTGAIIIFYPYDTPVISLLVVVKNGVGSIEATDIAIKIFKIIGLR